MRLRHRVTIKHDTAPDSVVDPSYAVLMAGVPCNVVPVSGGEKYRGKQLQAETNIVIETRYYSGWLPNMIAVNEQTAAQYLISRMIPRDGREREILIEAVEVTI